MARAHRFRLACKVWQLCPRVESGLSTVGSKPSVTPCGQPPVPALAGAAAAEAGLLWHRNWEHAGLSLSSGAYFFPFVLLPLIFLIY